MQELLLKMTVFVCLLMPFREVKCSLLCLMKAMIWLVPCGYKCRISLIYCFLDEN